MADEEEIEKSKVKLKALQVRRDDAKRQRIERLTVISEGPASSVPVVASAPAVAPINPLTAVPTPNALEL